MKLKPFLIISYHPSKARQHQLGGGAVVHPFLAGPVFLSPLLVILLHTNCISQHGPPSYSFVRETGHLIDGLTAVPDVKLEAFLLLFSTGKDTSI